MNPFETKAKQFKETKQKLDQYSGTFEKQALSKPWALNKKSMCCVTAESFEL